MASSSNLPHPLQTPDASSSGKLGSSGIVGSAGSSSGRGFGRSAPIRTLPNMSAGGGRPLTTAIAPGGIGEQSRLIASGDGASSVPKYGVDHGGSGMSVQSMASYSSPAAPSSTSFQQNQQHHSVVPPAPPHGHPGNAANAANQPSLPPSQKTQHHPLGRGSEYALTNATQQGQYTQLISQQQQSPPNQSYSQQPQFQKPSTTLIPSQHQPSSPSKQSQSSLSSNRRNPSTPEEEVDSFLLGLNQYQKSANQHQQPQKIVKTHPSPLPHTEGIVEKAKLLASRRAWGDVIRVTNDALIAKIVDGSPNVGSESSMGISGKYHEIYSDLIDAASSSSFDNATDCPDSPIATGVDPKLDALRKDTIELITLRFVAHLKLRRYNDLGKEVSQLGLIPHLPPHSTSISTSTFLSNESLIPPSPVEGSPQPQFSPNPGNGSTTITHHSFSWKEGSIHSSSSMDSTPSWVPYSLRILAAQQLQYSDGSAKAISVLYDMRDRAARTEYWDTSGTEVWRSTIDIALVNAFVRKREWRLALRSLEDLLGGLDECSNREVQRWCQFVMNEKGSGDVFVPSQNEIHQMKELIEAASTVELLSRQIVILLQSGCIDQAGIVQRDVDIFCTRAQQLVAIGASSSTLSNLPALSHLCRKSKLVRQAPMRRMVNEGLLCFARCNYNEAATCFRDTFQKMRDLEATMEVDSQMNPPGCPAWQDLSSPTLGFDADTCLTIECVNNLSLCLLHCGNMCMAVQEMEDLVRENPMLLTEEVAFNLCTLYELGSDGDECSRRKKVLQRVAKRFFLHDIGVESFRLNP